jgi:acetylornithine deacetylase
MLLRPPAQDVREALTMPALTTTVATLADLIGFPTVSSESNLELAGYLSNRLADAGARVEMVHNDSFTKASVFASLGPEEAGGILLSGHTDVVPVEGQDWSSDPFVLHEAEGRLFGRGSCDMKGFIAAALSLAADLKERELRRPLQFAFTYDEEIGCFGARALLDHLRGREDLPTLVRASCATADRCRG